MLIQIWFRSTSTKLLSFGLAAESFSKKQEPSSNKSNFIISNFYANVNSGYDNAKPASAPSSTKFVFPQSLYSLATLTQQPPHYSNNTTSNSNMAHFASQKSPNSESENEKTYLNLQ